MTMTAADAELVYNMTKAMVELFDDYKDGAPGNVGWDIKRQVFAWAIPMHDGAIRYFKERGLWTAEHQKHNDAHGQAPGRARRGLEGLQGEGAVRRRGIRARLDEGARRGAHARPAWTSC